MADPTPSDGLSARFAAARRFAKGDPAVESPEVTQMRANRRVNAKTANRDGSSLSFATGRPRDPLFYWKQNNLPYDINQDDELKKIREMSRLLYQTHPIIASAIDIYSKYPLLGSELVCKDQQLVDFHEGLFFTPEGLDYDEFMIDMGREYWITGEAWPFASFNESLGVWDDEELLNPDDVDVQRSPFLKDPRFFIRLPQSLREVISKRSPAWEYERLMRAYPELAHYANEDSLMPVSNVLLRQMKFKADTFGKRGVPILMRSMRAVMQEEMLNAAQDAIADRLYTPLILAKLGASATDLGTTVPWIPTADDLEDFQEALDGALAADFRVITHHFAVNMESVFGRENMPDLSADFDRLEGRILQTFGLSQTMLSGASSGETYAADALNRDLVSQLLTTFQRNIKNHYHQRALIVAEAQEHYDYDERGGKRYIKMEEVLEIDEETGEERIIEQPKLLVPELNFKTMNIADEESNREFYEQLRAAGVPISMKTRLVNVPIDFEEEIERTRDEQVQLAVAEQETRKAMFLALRADGLPIPQDLIDDFQAMAAQGLGPAGAQPVRTPMMGVDPITGTPNLAPTAEDLMAPEPGVPQPGMGASPVDADPNQANVPPESTEQMADMPKASILQRKATRMREIIRDEYEAPEEMKTLARTAKNDDGEPVGDEYTVPDPNQEPIPRGKFASPRHIGLRRYSGYVSGDTIDEDEPTDG